jgi:hypothetical protein
MTNPTTADVKCLIYNLAFKQSLSKIYDGVINQKIKEDTLSLLYFQKAIDYTCDYTKSELIDLLQKYDTFCKMDMDCTPVVNTCIIAITDTTPTPCDSVNISIQ